MTHSLDEYNGAVVDEQRRHGMRAPDQPVGSELKPGAWRDAEARAGLKTIETGPPR
jgi:hypothetical protein